MKSSDNTGPLFDNFLDRTLEALTDFHPQVKETSDRCAVIVETRCHPALEAVVKNVLYFVGDQWSLTMFHGDDNQDYARELFAGTNIRLINIHGIATRDDYNKLLTSISFWESIKAEYVLLFQCDSALRRNGIEDFLAYDYVGSPWRQDCPWNLPDLSGGNGGISLRNREHSIDTINRVPCKDGLAEDIYFVHAMNLLGMNVAPRDVCTRFGAETLFSSNPLAVHAIERYLSADEVTLLLDFEYPLPVRQPGY